VIIIPAIDLKDGFCVRLAQGDFNRTTVYDGDPVAVAKRWEEEGAQRIHLVDLDGSLAGKPKNKEVIARIVAQVGIPVEVGGGIRNRETIEEYLKMGVRWVILGTAAVRDEKFFAQACRSYQGHVILGLDAIEGKIAIQGWTEKEKIDAIELAKRYTDYGMDSIIYTDIKRDGMKTGLNVEETRRLAEAVNVPVIASGGVAGLEDIVRLMEVAHIGIAGVIIGRALYTGDISLAEAIAITTGGAP